MAGDLGKDGVRASEVDLQHLRDAWSIRVALAPLNRIQPHTTPYRAERLELGQLAHS
jgi:hypothetical protein